ncbi:MAG: 23S rRNA (pseudouridine(1915)-N(3))-methyltransferase RlmH [Betaproteobacteria bacterium]|jgi:23S rRNA (pseudouridine1915-N3)-methyltransferase|nr:23S rRNA (pseudouridine(1915)-N(3))-methyltransferase RlmH [Polynucleobacter sp.]NBY63232.1 23S rRNA (pseudouridine(1915)-N(3))-methyltransferase RlmH [Betaproteobacteria bacterium]
MKLLVIAVGHKMPQWVQIACEDYLKRMPREYTLEVKELKPDITPSKEALKIRQVIAKGDHVIAMDEHGMDITTLHMSKTMTNWRLLGKNIALIIGGANGLDQSILQMANEIWRLSSLTLPHAMARLLLIEQLYRSYTILENHPYHRE